MWANLKVRNLWGSKYPYFHGFYIDDPDSYGELPKKITSCLLLEEVKVVVMKYSQ